MDEYDYCSSVSSIIKEMMTRPPVVARGMEMAMDMDMEEMEMEMEMAEMEMARWRWRWRWRWRDGDGDDEVEMEMETMGRPMCTMMLVHAIYKDEREMG